MTNCDERQRPLAKTGTRAYVHRLLATGHAYDIDKDGLYDARSGAINIWCAPTDKPSCWVCEITKGDCKHPRDFVGGLYWDWQDNDAVTFRLDCTPYNLIRHLRRERRPRYGQPTLTDTEWDQVMSWLDSKVTELFRLADLHPTIVGTRCPLCDYVLPTGRLLNELLNHIEQAHDKEITGMTLGAGHVIHTSTGDLQLRDAEVF